MRLRATTRRKCKRKLRSVLLTEDGVILEGCGFGSPGIKVGELVFTTGMVGYPESLTDPSYKGQILIITYPLIGNYGVPDKGIKKNGIPLHYESDKIQVEALVVAYETDPSHWASTMSLHRWLKSEGVPGVSNVDTRMLVEHIREKGTVMAVVAVYPESEEVDIEQLKKILESSERYDYKNLVDAVAPSKIILHAPDHGYDNTVILIDCGVKYGIIRELLRRRIRVIRVPPHEDPVKCLEEYSAGGVVISNGPGNPALLTNVIENCKVLIEYNVPMLGICLGHQLLSIAAGARTFKLKYGHRGLNKPCLDLETGKCFVTSQNHGFAVDVESLDGTGLKLWAINADDMTVEAVKHSKFPVFSVQFHPEASPGPTDASWIFDLFFKNIEKYCVNRRGD